jgi:hypothetical protein
MLILEANLARNMTDEHFISALHCDATIMRTPIEIELIRRLESALDRLKPLDGFDELIIDYELKAESLERLLESNHKANFDEIADFLAVLHDAEIETADELKAVLIEADLLKEF